MKLRFPVAWRHCGVIALLSDRLPLWAHLPAEKIQPLVPIPPDWMYSMHPMNWCNPPGGAKLCESCDCGSYPCGDCENSVRLLSTVPPHAGARSWLTPCFVAGEVAQFAGNRCEPVAVCGAPYACLVASVSFCKTHPVPPQLPAGVCLSSSMPLFTSSGDGAEPVPAEARAGD